MNILSLSLRQRKLLHYLSQSTGYVSGDELASHLHVSSRTVRNDISELNHLLSGMEIQILSRQSYGYLLKAENAEALARLNQSSGTFLTREDRIRHIAFGLCLTDVPLLLPDLEDEMFISRTTLEHDLEEVRSFCCENAPYIELNRSRNHISFEKNERKRRYILNRMFADNWNYNAKGNAYHPYQFMEEDIIDLIMEETNQYMKRYDILMDDINVVILNLSIAIMYYRIRKGHQLGDAADLSHSDSASVHAVMELLDTLEEKLECTFPEIERNEICQHVSCSRLLDRNKLNFATMETYFTQTTLTLAEEYLGKIHTLFHLDLSADEDFYVTLLQFLRYIDLPVHNLNEIQIPTEMLQPDFLIALNLAYFIQPQILACHNRLLDHHELLYLSFCILGALSKYNHTFPRHKTILMCHLNLPAAWNLRQRLLDQYKDQIDLLAILPVYVKDSYDFTKIDLVITTANKEITTAANCRTIVISPFLNHADQQQIETYLLGRQMARLYPPDLLDVRILLKDAFRHDALHDLDSLAVMTLLSEDFISRGITTEAYRNDIFQRESILSYAVRSGHVFVFSYVPGTQTRLSIGTLTHSIRWGEQRIHTVIMAVLKEEDFPLIFSMINELFHKDLKDSRLPDISG